MNAKFFTLCCVGIIALASLGSLGSIASAQECAPPVGHWSGRFDDGSGGITLNLSGNGNAFIQVTGGPAITGRWTWAPSSRGGIVTIHYLNGGSVNRLYYSVTYVSADRILFSDPFFRIVLDRR